MNTKKQIGKYNLSIINNYISNNPFIDVNNTEKIYLNNLSDKEAKKYSIDKLYVYKIKNIIGNEINIYTFGYSDDDFNELNNKFKIIEHKEISFKKNKEIETINNENNIEEQEKIITLPKNKIDIKNIELKNGVVHSFGDYLTVVTKNDKNNSKNKLDLSNDYKYEGKYGNYYVYSNKNYLYLSNNDILIKVKGIEFKDINKVIKESTVSDKNKTDKKSRKAYWIDKELTKLEISKYINKAVFIKKVEEDNEYISSIKDAKLLKVYYEDDRFNKLLFDYFTRYKIVNNIRILDSIRYFNGRIFVTEAHILYSRKIEYNINIKFQMNKDLLQYLYLNKHYEKYYSNENKRLYYVDKNTKKIIFLQDFMDSEDISGIIPDIKSFDYYINVNDEIKNLFDMYFDVLSRYKANATPLDTGILFVENRSNKDLIEVFSYFSIIGIEYDKVYSTIKKINEYGIKVKALIDNSDVYIEGGNILTNSKNFEFTTSVDYNKTYIETVIYDKEKYRYDDNDFMFYLKTESIYLKKEDINNINESNNFNYFSLVMGVVIKSDEYINFILNMLNSGDILFKLHLPLILEKNGKILMENTQMSVFYN